MKVQAEAPKVNRSIEVEYNFGENLEEMRKLFADDVIFSNARQNLVIGLQGLIRRHLAAGKQDAEITEAVQKWVPGVASGPRQTTFQRVSTDVTKLSPEERKALLKQLKEAA